MFRPEQLGKTNSGIFESLIIRLFAHLHPDERVHFKIHVI